MILSIQVVFERTLSDSDWSEFSSVVVRAIRLLTGYKRVLIYQFDQEGHGQSLAEKDNFVLIDEQGAIDAEF